MLQKSAERRLVPKRRKPKVRYETFGDVLRALGDVPAGRVRFDIKPGRATVRDLIKLDVMGEPPNELVDGFIVEKAVGNKEGFLSNELGRHLGNFVEEYDLGYVCGADGMFRFKPKLVRLPDVAFTSWSKLPEHAVPDEPVPYLVPDLAVEVLSESNSKGEIDRKLREFFEAGVRLTWVIDPKTRTAKVYRSVAEFTEVPASGSLDGGEVLPGFKLPLSRLFAKLGPIGKRRKKSK